LTERQELTYNPTDPPAKYPSITVSVDSKLFSIVLSIVSTESVA